MASSGGRLSRVTEGIVLCQREAVVDWWIAAVLPGLPKFEDSQAR